MSQRLIIERFFEDMALCEINGEPVELPRELLPEGAKPGDVLTRLDDSESWQPDPEETAHRRRLVSERFGRLFGRREPEEAEKIAEKIEE